MREDYLKSWKKYPSFPGAPYLGGRIVGKHHGALSVVAGNDTYEVCRSWTFSHEAEPWDVLETLREGDWIAIAPKEQKVLLMAPCLEADFSHRGASDLQWQFLEFVVQVRSFFQSLGFLECSTPSLVPCPGMEPHLAPFSTQWKFGSQKKTTYLPTSPELHLKKLLAKGYGNLFEIKRVFRNEEQSPCHEPEFLMLEWYRSFENLETIANDCESLLKKLGFNQGIESKTVAQLFYEQLEFDLSPITSHDELLGLASDLKIAAAGDDTWDEIFLRIFCEKIEPELKNSPALILSKYPPSQSALARIDENGWADRFELYIHGIECANAFFELNDPEEQQLRFEKDQQYRRENNLEDVPIDREFLKHLRQGMPPAAGIALGVERLFMALKKAPNLGAFLEFTHIR